MGNICFGVGDCCKPGRNTAAGSYRACHQGKPVDNPYLDPSPERSGYHLALAKVDSAPSASVGLHGVNTGLCGSGSAIHANSEASLLKIHHNRHDSAAASIMAAVTSAPRKSFASRIPPLGRSGSSETKHGSEAKINALFEKYRNMDLLRRRNRSSGTSQLSSGCGNGSNGSGGYSPGASNLGSSSGALSGVRTEEDVILALGTEALCDDLELKPDDFRILIFAWKCNADQMCRFTRSQFVHGCRSLKGADSVKAIQTRLQDASSELQTRPDFFKDLYRFTYHFGLASCSQNNLSTPSASISGEGCAMAVSGLSPRNLPIDMAIALWRLVFSQNEPLILSRWLNFLQTPSGPMVRSIQEDAWNMFLHLCETVGHDLSTYTEDDAWPSLFDDFVEFENDQANQNCHGKNFYSKEDVAVSTQTVNEGTDQLAISSHICVDGSDDELPTLSKSILGQDKDNHTTSSQGKDHRKNELDE